MSARASEAAENVDSQEQEEELDSKTVDQTFTDRLILRCFGERQRRQCSVSFPRWEELTFTEARLVRLVG